MALWARDLACLTGLRPPWSNFNFSIVFEVYIIKGGSRLTSWPAQEKACAREQLSRADA